MKPRRQRSNTNRSLKNASKVSGQHHSPDDSQRTLENAKPFHGRDLLLLPLSSSNRHRPRIKTQPSDTRERLMHLLGSQFNRSFLEGHSNQKDYNGQHMFKFLSQLRNHQGTEGQSHDNSQKDIGATSFLPFLVSEKTTCNQLARQKQTIALNRLDCQTSRVVEAQVRWNQMRALRLELRQKLGGRINNTLDLIQSPNHNKAGGGRMLLDGQQVTCSYLFESSLRSQGEHSPIKQATKQLESDYDMNLIRMTNSRDNILASRSQHGYREEQLNCPRQKKLFSILAG